MRSLSALSSGRGSTADGAPVARAGSGALAVVRVAVAIGLFAAVVVVAVREWHDVSGTIEKISPEALVGATALALVGLGASALTWRCCLRELGATVTVPEALKIYLVGQLGKYMPGSLWALVVQMELARRASVRRTQSLGAGMVAIGINLVTGIAVGLGVLPSVADGSRWRYVVAALGLGVCAVAIAPPCLGRIGDFLLGVLRRPPLERRPGWAGILSGAALSVGSWIAYGLGLWVLAVAAGADAGRTLALALPAVALAMTIGFVVVVAPSGIGVREAVLVAALAPVLAAGPALGVALVLRLVFTLADLVAALVAFSLPVLSLRSETVRTRPL